MFLCHNQETAIMTATAAAAKQIPIVCPGHTRPLAELQYISVQEDGQDRTFLLSACHDRMPMMRDASTGDWIGTWAGHKGAVWSCQVDATCSLAATASGDFSAKVWDAITGNSLMDLPHKHIVKTCVFSPNSRRLATGGKESIVRVYELTELLLNKDASKTPAVEIKQQSPVTKLAFLSDTLLLAACQNGKIYLWDTAANGAATLKHTFDTGATAEIRDMEVRTINNHQQTILTVAAGDTVFFFDTATHVLLHQYKMPIHFKEEGGATLHPSGHTFVAGGSDLWVRVFDFATGRELECHKGHHGPIRCVRYSPDGKSYASGSEDGTIRLWKTDPEAEGEAKQ
jgi:serine-threonine kinase receptor-associated protein